mmetsp:Transcript_18542/g.44457  ORF Transcript_18542/g.44457 Transcript_18542/m.44457 type:complete len:105 (+) Transcript_18542:176-490(+)
MGWAACAGSLSIKLCHSSTGLIVIRCSRDTHSLVWGAMTLIRQIQKTGCQLRVLSVCGAVRTCQSRTLAAVQNKIRERPQKSGPSGPTNDLLSEAQSAIAALAY